MSNFRPRATNGATGQLGGRHIVAASIQDASSQVQVASTAAASGDAVADLYGGPVADLQVQIDDLMARLAAAGIP